MKTRNSRRRHRRLKLVKTNPKSHLNADRSQQTGLNQKEIARQVLNRGSRARNYQIFGRNKFSFELMNGPLGLRNNLYLNLAQQNRFLVTYTFLA